MRAGTKRPKDTVTIRLMLVVVGGGLQRVKVSIWWRGRERDFARGLIGTFFVALALSETHWWEFVKFFFSSDD
jgi:hypothetical protein